MEFILNPNNEYGRQMISMFSDKRKWEYDIYFLRKHFEEIGLIEYEKFKSTPFPSINNVRFAIMEPPCYRLLNIEKEDFQSIPYCLRTSNEKIEVSIDESYVDIGYEGSSDEKNATLPLNFITFEEIMTYNREQVEKLIEDFKKERSEIFNKIF